VELTRGLYSELEDTSLTTRALDYLSRGPADVVDLIGHICALPGAPRVVAEHMAHAMFAGRPQFVRNDDGRWMLADLTRTPYSASGRPDTRGPDEALRDLSYVVVDTETTGGRSWLNDRITEVAAVVVRGGEIVEVYETLVNPRRSIPPFISALTNITWDMVKDAPVFEQVAPEVLRVLEGNIFVAHNATFDWRFLTSELTRATGRQLRGRRLCTVKLARKVLPQLPRRSLDHVARYYGVTIRNRHRAGGDAIATAHCLIRMVSDLADRGCFTWSELQTLLRAQPGRRKKRRHSGLPTPVTRDTTA
jgi:DNA polymerase III subunit epsilon